MIVLEHITIRLCGLPLLLTLISDGTVQLNPQGSFKEIFDLDGKEIVAVISSEEIVVSGETFLYNSCYKPTANLRSWLTKQNMISPL